MTEKSGLVVGDPAGSATLEVLCRGLVGYVSFLAACGGHPVYSEYALYEPILRMGHAQGYKVRCEVPVKKRKRTASTGGARGGDHPRIDFDFMRPGPKGNHFGLEVKWTNKSAVGVKNDVDKLKRHAKKHPGCSGYLLVFGPYGIIDDLTPRGLGSLLGQSRLIGWSAGKTKYGARWYRVV